MRSDRSASVADQIWQAHGIYSAARRVLQGLSPCPKCCPPINPCTPGERIKYGEIVRCKKCVGEGFFIKCEDEDEDDA